MLQELFIRNFAIIDDLSVSFLPGLTVLTGETGAGKSIIINAVNLLLGSRANPKLIRTGADTAELEARFLVTENGAVARLMNEYALDPSEGLLIRRIISRSDGNRIYINGRQATIQMLGQLTENLAGIAGQHAHQKLLKEDEHLLILDQYAGLVSLRSGLSECYRKVVPLTESFRQLKEKKRQAVGHMELLEFQRREISDVNPIPDEDATLEQERIRLKNSAMLIRTVHDGLDLLHAAPGSASEQLTTVRKAIENAARLDPDLAGPGKQLGEILFQLEDIIQFLQDYQDRDGLEEGRMEQVEARLDTLNKLKRKYGGSLEAVIEQLGAIDRTLHSMDDLDAQIEAVQKQLSDDHDQLAHMARVLSQKRAVAAKTLSKKIEEELITLDMPKARFDILLDTQPARPDIIPYLSIDNKCLHETGLDLARFMISPNAGEALKPLSAIASGGELSRVVLALKAILADSDSVESIVFDEVDAGIGGGVAEMVGKKLSSLARSHQVICITHLPQIAKFGTHHFKISKHVVNERTRTAIEPVKNEARIQELARMLGGETITEAAMNHARELLEKK
jgi:DNA repair protein RecN (Recombination protein N)